jgi:hypothetical protein
MSLIPNGIPSLKRAPRPDGQADDTDVLSFADPAPFRVPSAPLAAVAAPAPHPFLAAGTPGAPAPAAAAPAAASPSGSAPKAASGATSLPSWVASLSTASIKTDMTAADVGGTVGYAGLEKVFADLGGTLASSGTALTAAEFSDLKTIAANLNNGMSTSAYLVAVTNDLVDGNAANATWTGGAAKSAALGNLAVGSSATQLNELVGKWFLGTDLPSSTVQMSGTPTFSVSYSAPNLPLYGAAGPSINDVNQGYLGDCFLLASAGELASQNPSAVQSMITANGNGTYGVRFYVNGAATYVTVNGQLADGGTEFNEASDLWASLVEKAYTQLQAGGNVTGNGAASYGNSWSSIGNGGYPEYALEQLTGASQIVDYYANGSSWGTQTYNQSLAVTGGSGGASTASVLSVIAADLSKGYEVVLSSNTNAYVTVGGKTMQTLVSGHAMSVYGYDASTGCLEIRNPWGTMSGQTWQTTFEVGLSTLLGDGDTLSVATLPASAPAAPGAPTVTSQTATQTAVVGKAFSFSLAANTFTDPQGSALSYAATQSGGAALPSWLSFNAATETFSGTAAAPAGTTAITVKATDAYGLSASETFNLVTAAAKAPDLVSQTANQTEVVGKAFSFSLAANTFTDPQGSALSYAAAQSGGAALPSWLSFNAATETFSGTAPTGTSSLSLKVTATDAYGLSASETFGVSFSQAAKAPTVTNQTPTQTWVDGTSVSFALPANTFTDPQGQKLTYAAYQLLTPSSPTVASWLRFNPTTETFSGAVPTTAAGSLALEVVATDASGLSATDVFNVNLVKPGTAVHAAVGTAAALVPAQVSGVAQLAAA